MKDRPDGTVELDDDERGTLIVSAACYAILWSVGLGVLNVVAALTWSPVDLTTALWWFSVTFVGVFLWKRYWLLEQANEIINRTNARIKEEIDRA